MNDKIDKEIVFDLINNVISCLNRHSFLKRQDMEEWMALISKYFYDREIYVMPIGAGWCFEADKEDVEKYLGEHKDFFDKYRKWIYSQR